MDRSIAYTSEQGRSTDFLFAQRAALIGLGKLAQTTLGTATVVDGLQTTQTSPASMSVQVAIGNIYSVQPVDATAYGVLPADTTDSIVKQGMLMAAATLATPAPTTAGYSINYLVQAVYQDQDTNNVVLPYFNSANPLQPLTGQNNSGAPQPTQRQGVCVVAVKAGAAATTGSQTTPAPDAGYVGLYVVTVAYGASTVVNANISPYAGTPALPASLLQMIQQGHPSYAVATGTANAHVVALTPALAARVDGMVIRYKAPAANTGALTLNDGVGTVAVVGAAHSALQGGETVANGDVWVQWNSSIGGGSYVMVDSTGGAAQVAPATQSNQAVNLGQFVASLVQNGYVKLPNGWIIQQGLNSIVGTAGTAFNYPLAFPSACFALVGIVNNVSSTTTFATAFNNSRSQGAFRLNAGVTVNVSWIAIGK